MTEPQEMAVGADAVQGMPIALGLLIAGASSVTLWAALILAWLMV
jgi:hypothetical protein